MSANKRPWMPVILCGGMGTRLWPLSRTHTPKQFISIQGKTLFTRTLERLQGLDLEKALIVGSEAHRFFIADELAKVSFPLQCTTLLEPVARDTAPALGLAALYVTRLCGNDPMLVMPSDHVIQDVPAFQGLVAKTLSNLQEDEVITFGISCDAPRASYGYLEQGEALGDGFFQVRAFHEKPDAETAAQWLATGKYYWNSGLFLFYAQHYLDLLERHAHDIWVGCQESYKQAQNGRQCLDFPEETFAAIRKLSCDYAVMEKTEKMKMVCADFGWSDVGSWKSLGDLFEHDAAGNKTQGDVVLQNAQNNIVYAQKRMVSVYGVDDCVVAETPDAVLVTSRAASDGLKQLLSKMESAERTEVEWANKVFRPWGSYEQIDQGQRFQVKRIIVKPGQVLSLQLHHKRSEHWIVVSGIARVTRGETVFDLKANESTYIPVGTKHRLENCGDEDLFLIEVQCGSYLGEDDIVRFEDIYGRAQQDA